MLLAVFGIWLSAVLVAAALTVQADAQDIFVSIGGSSTVSEYTTSGALVNPSVISGIRNGMVVSGSDLFVVNSNNGTIGEYNATTGAVVNASLISDPNEPYRIAASGSYLFVTNQGNSTIGEYTTSGATVNASLISGLMVRKALPFLGRTCLS